MNRSFKCLSAVSGRSAQPPIPPQEQQNREVASTAVRSMHCSRVQPDTDCVHRILSKPPEQRTWRMQQAVICRQHATDCMALLSKRDQPSRLQGLAHALLSKFYAVGYSQVQPAMLTQISDVVGVMREDPENFTRVNKGNGRQLVASKMQPGDYVLMLAAEALALFFNFSVLQPDSQLGVAAAAAADVTQQEMYDHMTERVHGALAKMSGNMASTVRDAQGRLSQRLPPRPSRVSLVAGGSVPADVVIGAQLLSYGIHPKQLAWVMHVLIYEAAHTLLCSHPSAAQRPKLLHDVLHSANAMVLLAANPAEQPRHPGIDISATADAVCSTICTAVNTGSSTVSSRAGGRGFVDATTTGAGAVGGGHSSSSGSGVTTIHQTGLPPPGTVSDAQLVQMLRGFPVAVLKEWLQEEGLPYSHCVEKEDLVQLVSKTHTSDAYKAKPRPQPHTPRHQRSDADTVSPLDICCLMHMAMFLKAEAGEVAEGRSPAVVAASKAAATLSLQHDDELYGCLCAWNAVRAIKDSGRPFLLGELLQWLDVGYDCQRQLSHWNGYLGIDRRIKVLKEMKSSIKEMADLCRNSGSSSSKRSSYSYDSIRHSQVRALVQPGDEHLEVSRAPAVGTTELDAVIGKGSRGKPCAHCKLLFDARLVCSGCKSVWYCGKDCQKAAWKEHKKECPRLKEQKAAAAAASSRQANKA